MEECPPFSKALDATEDQEHVKMFQTAIAGKHFDKAWANDVSVLFSSDSNLSNLDSAMKHSLKPAGFETASLKSGPAARKGCGRRRAHVLRSLIHSRVDGGI